MTGYLLNLLASTNGSATLPNLLFRKCSHPKFSSENLARTLTLILTCPPSWLQLAIASKHLVQMKFLRPCGTWMMSLQGPNITTLDFSGIRHFWESILSSLTLQIHLSGILLSLFLWF